MSNVNCITPSWQEMQDYAKKTSENIKKSKFRPDVIIGLSRGGLVPARLFCDYLHIKNCYTIKVDHWGITATKDGQAKLTQNLDMDLTDMNVLIVDDITDTGQSMEVAKKYLEELNPKKVKTATLIHLKDSKYVPDFFGIEREWAWIIFPWNFQEDLVNLTNKMFDSHPDLTVEEIIIKFKEDHKTDVSKEDVEETLKQIEYLREFSY